MNFAGLLLYVLFFISAFSTDVLIMTCNDVLLHNNV